MKLRTITCMFTVIFAGCSSINRNTTFDAAGGQSFALIAADSDFINPTVISTFEFHKVDLKTSVFLPESFHVTFSNAGTLQGDEFGKPKQLETTVRFAGKPASPGDYVLTSRSDNYFNQIQKNCYSLGALVFRIRAGEINIIPMGNIGGANSPAPLHSQISMVMAGYPKMAAPVSMVGVIGKSTFEAQKSLLGGATCYVGKLNSFQAM